MDAVPQIVLEVSKDNDTVENKNRLGLNLVVGKSQLLLVFEDFSDTDDLEGNRKSFV